jgi:aryl-alcohol dehydrogenase-like predicted oxidoreductase
VRKRRLGSSGLQVSRLGLGTLTWGDVTEPGDATAQLTAFVERGGTLVETCDAYAGGKSQRVLGEALGRVRRDRLVLAARTTNPVSGPGRGPLLAALDATLKRLGVDHLDLWQLPAFPQPDGPVPLDETLTAVQVAVLSGRVRYAGLVAPRGWQVATVAERARTLGPATAPVSVQAEYSLLARDPDIDLVAAAGFHGVGLLARAPLGRGVLTGKYLDGTPADSRGASAAHAPYVEARRTERSTRIVHAVLTAADGLGTSPLAVALAWVRDRPGVAAAVVGARDTAQLAASLAAEALVLPPEIRAALDDVSGPAPH